MNFYPFNDIETISPRPMLFITGDQAHSREFSEDAYKRAAEPKELVYRSGRGPRRSLRPREPDPVRQADASSTSILEHKRVAETTGGRCRYGYGEPFIIGWALRLLREAAPD